MIRTFGPACLLFCCLSSSRPSGEATRSRRSPARVSRATMAARERPWRRISTSHSALNSGPTAPSISARSVRTASGGWTARAADLTTVAGAGRQGYAGDGGPAEQALLNEPYEVRFDRDGNMFFVEMRNHLVRRVDAKTKIITTVAGCGEAGDAGDGGPAVKAKLRTPHSIAFDAQGRLLIADIGNHRIRRVDLASGKIESIAGNGQAKMPEDGKPARGRPVLGPRALAVENDTLWVALREGNSIWRLDLTQGTWRHAAGTLSQGLSRRTGAGSSAQRAERDRARCRMAGWRSPTRRITPFANLIPRQALCGPLPAGGPSRAVLAATAALHSRRNSIGCTGSASARTAPFTSAIRTIIASGELSAPPPRNSRFAPQNFERSQMNLLSSFVDAPRFDD